MILKSYHNLVFVTCLLKNRHNVKLLGDREVLEVSRSWGGAETVYINSNRQQTWLKGS